MIITKRHGTPAIRAIGSQLSARHTATFGYFFPKAPVLDPGKTAALDALAEAMSDQQIPDAGNAGVPPAYTYFGQFIDHDLTANTDRETDFSSVVAEEIVPAPRSDVTINVQNLRQGSFDLDSMYGGLPDMDDTEQRFASMLRHPVWRDKMWVGTVEPSAIGDVPLPMDPGKDLLRLERIIRAPNQQITKDEVRALPSPQRDAFVNADGSLRKARAIIGDGRNDENLVVAQLHLAMLRFHNKVVDHIGDQGGQETTFERARQIVRWVYQWLVINDYLIRICGEDVVREVVDQHSPLYAGFADQMRTTPPFAPMPLEFSVAAFRFGHTMVRAEYDWSRHFGRAVESVVPQLDRSPFELLFAFTGGAHDPMLGSSDRLPGHWPVEWDRFTDESGTHADRAARSFDTQLVPPLFDMVNESDTPGSVLRDLARRNLRRGYRLNIPNAQDAIAGIYASTGTTISGLSADALVSGPTGDAVQAGGFAARTPLWFYILKEAEITQNGQRLGPLGARLVAETLVGLIQKDPNSYWNVPGRTPGHWHPGDEGLSGVVSLAGLLRFAGVL